MKKFLKRIKGFTLIELLAVIVILAIIAIIAVPIVMNIINESRKNAAVISADGYIRAVNYKVAQEQVNGNIVPPGEYVIGDNALEVDARNIDKITGSYELGESTVLTAGLCVDKYSIEYSSGKAYYKGNANYCSGGFVFNEPNGELLSRVCDADGDTVYSDNTEFKIKTVEDLVCLSTKTNAGKNFSGKKIYLLSNLNISDKGSYKSSTTTKYGDINGNETVEGLLTELTTGKGFKPIGSNNKTFNGEFYGYAFTISNLMINRPSESYVGLFGYNRGLVIGIKLIDVNITGGQYTGAVAGYTHRTLKDMDVKGTVKSTSEYAGGVIGGNHYTDGAVANNLMFSGSVTGLNCVGGINGYGPANGVVYNSTIAVTTSNNKYIGKANGYVYGGTYKVSNVTLSYAGSRESSTTDGIEVPDVDISAFDGVLDTYIGGDNDSDGYYFDYDSNGNLILLSSERNPIQNKLKGEGTSEKPYIIKNYKDWKMATALATSSKYFSVAQNIDFTDKKYYALGTPTNKFNGRINGNMYTLSNISTSGFENIGLFGYNTGVIEGFNLKNITINAYGDNTGIVGYNTGTVKGISGDNITVSSRGRYTGGGIGYSTGAVNEIKIKGTITSTNEYTGGVVGGNHYTGGATANNLLFIGSVTGSNAVGGVNGFGPANGVVHDSSVTATYTGNNKYIGKANGYVYGGTYKVKNVTLTYSGSRESSTSDGVEIPEITIVAVDGVLDTILGGDNDTSGYYFDYNTSGELDIYSIAKDPLVNSLKGSGTQADPYIIANANDWRIASSIANQGKYFSVTADIDFTGKIFYPMGSNSNRFNGHINGNMHTLSNISVSGNDCIGVFGYNTGVIEGFNFNNITINSRSDYAGIVGYNTGTVKGINGKNITVTSNGNYIGGGVGYSTGTVNEININGSITTTGQYAGGAIGGNHYTGGATASNLLFSGSVTSNNSAGGVTGYGPANGVVYDSSVTITYTGSYKYIGKANGYVYGGTFRVKNVTLSYSNSRESSTSDGIAINDVDIISVDGVLDTIVGGDNDNSGYYFDFDSNGKLVVLSTAKNPITNTLSGEGTQASPYLIKNANDWKVATSLANKSKYFSITQDIDFTGRKFYPLGTGSNKFNGNINGNMHTLSNINITGYENVGAIGYNTGVVEGIKFENITISSTGNNVGVIGCNDNLVKGISVSNINVTSTGNYVSGGIGYNNRNMNEIIVKGTITSTGTYVSGVVANHYTGTSAKNLVFKGSVTGNNQVGGINSYGSATGVVYDSSVTATYTGNYKYIGKANGYVYGGTYRVKDVTLTYSGSRESATSDGTAITELTIANISPALDTTDSDSDGYKFTITNGEIELVKN